MPPSVSPRRLQQMVLVGALPLALALARLPSRADRQQFAERLLERVSELLIHGPLSAGQESRLRELLVEINRFRGPV